jgi:hypothetical protein
MHDRPVSSSRLACLVTLSALAAMAYVPASFAQPGGGHPDFSGVWFPQGFARRTPNPLPFTEAAQKLADEFKAEFTAEDDPGKYCIWPGMPRVIWGAPFAIEMFHRPQDLTIYWEGYGMYRKIYMADANPPEAILNTAMGHSLAHWEGNTLVIETTNLRPWPYMDDLPATSDATVTERYSLERREQDGEMREFIVADVTLTDPRVYTEPVTMRAQARREPDLFILEYTCSTTLWEEYLQQHDLTPPDIDALP